MKELRPALIALALGCHGVVHEPGGGPGSSTPESTCAQTANAEELATLKRLSAREYERTLRDLIATLMDDATADAILAETSAARAMLPPDEVLKQRPYRNLSQTVSQRHVDVQYDAALAIGAAMVANDARLGALMGSCATDSDGGNDAACLDALVARLVPAAMRRPVSAEELAFFRDEAYIDGDAIDRDGVGELIAVVLMSPQFLFHFEAGAPGATPPAAQLSPHELASRLSYTFWGAPPDDELVQHADDGSLMDPTTYRAQVDRVFADPRTSEVLGQFLSEWMMLEVDGRAVIDFSTFDTPDFATFFGSVAPDGALHDAMLQEIVDLALHYIYREPGTLGDLFTTDLSFARTPALAAFYGVEPWDGTATPPILSDGRRSGLLTRAGMLTHGSVLTHPVLRGVRIRRQVLCDCQPDPPPNVMPPQVSAEQSTRDRYDALTEAPGCTACHSQINPLGYALEHYDSLGRYREIEQTIGDGGELLHTYPVDSNVIPHVSPTDETPAADGIELSRLVSESPKVEECFARQWFRFVFRRWENLQDPVDRDAVMAIRDALREGTLADGLRAAVMHSEFAIHRGGA